MMRCLIGGFLMAAIAWAGLGPGGPQALGCPGPMGRPAWDGPGPMGRWWQHVRIQQELGLQPDQIRQLDDIYYRFQPEIMDLQNAVGKARLNLEQAMSSTQWDERQVMDAARQLMEARNRLNMKRLEMILHMRRVLQTDQWQKLQTLRQHLKFRWMERHGRRPPGGPPSPPPDSPRPPSEN